MEGSLSFGLLGISCRGNWEGSTGDTGGKKRSIGKGGADWITSGSMSQ